MANKPTKQDNAKQAKSKPQTDDNDALAFLKAMEDKKKSAPDQCMFC